MRCGKATRTFCSTSIPRSTTTSASGPFSANTSRPRYGDGLRFSHVLALVRSFYRLGLVGQERFHYWKLLLWTQFRRPRLIPEAVILAIYGYHFRKVCERHVM